MPGLGSLCLIAADSVCQGVDWVLVSVWSCQALVVWGVRSDCQGVDLPLVHSDCRRVDLLLVRRWLRLRCRLGMWVMGVCGGEELLGGQRCEGEPASQPWPCPVLNSLPAASQSALPQPPTDLPTSNTLH